MPKQKKRKRGSTSSADDSGMLYNLELLRDTHQLTPGEGQILEAFLLKAIENTDISDEISAKDISDFLHSTDGPQNITVILKQLVTKGCLRVARGEGSRGTYCLIPAILNPLQEGKPKPDTKQSSKQKTPKRQAPRSAKKSRKSRRGNRKTTRAQNVATDVDERYGDGRSYSYSSAAAKDRNNAFWGDPSESYRTRERVA